MDAARVDDWVRRYRGAWETNDAAAIADLFTVDAAYYTEPYAEPWRGRDEIVRAWLARRDDRGDTRFDHEVVAAGGDVAVVRATTSYVATGRRYANLWEVRLDTAGRCREFVEWWMEIPTRENQKNDPK